MKIADPRARRGVVLLIVLALLALFAMIGIAFVVLTGHARRSAKSVERIDRVTDPPRKALQQALMQVLRGPAAVQTLKFPVAGGTSFSLGDSIRDSSGLKSGIFAGVTDDGTTRSLTVNLTGIAFATGDTITGSPSGATATVASVVNPASVMGAHSLLEGIYGATSRVAAVTSATPASPVCGGQLVRVEVVSPPAAPQLPSPVLSAAPARSPASCSGCVITFLNGPRTKGLSTRIVTHYPATTGAGATPDYFHIVATDSITAANITADVTELAATTTEPLYYLINGVPFSGTGFGFNTATGQLDLRYDSNPPTPQQQIDSAPGGNPMPTTRWELALLPNAPENCAPPGGANSDYTAADFQHMLLAAQVTNSAALGGIQTLPSLHRSSLNRYWAQRSWPPLPAPQPDFTTAAGLQAAASNTTNLPMELKRRINLRPLPEDHPNFSGSNPTYQGSPYASGFNPMWDGQSTFGTTPVPFSWDVDNDGDGVPDSVWVDLGMPVRTTTDGRKYKPLFAILCTDLDGRLNLNAHGSLTQADTNYDNLWTVDPATGGYLQYDSAQSAYVQTAGSPPPVMKYAASAGLPALARGLGLGPAEINLKGILGTNYQQVLIGTSRYEGRYGWTAPAAASPAAGPGTSDLDLLTWNKWFQYAGYQNSVPANIKAWWGFLVNPGTYVLDAFGTPPDPFGVGAVGLDAAGRPIYAGMRYQGISGYQNYSTGEYLGLGSDICDITHSMNLPYSMNLGRGASYGLSSVSGAFDNPFGPAELERLLRPYDADAPRLPRRLAELAPNLLPSPANPIPNPRFNVTTESWDLPCPNMVTPPNMTGWQTLPAKRVQHITDLLVARGIPTTKWSQLLPPELLAGLKLDLNRPFGCGRADTPVGQTGYGIVDPPPPAAQGSSDTLTFVTPAGNVNVPFTYNPNGVTADPTGTIAVNSQQARELQARYLYVLAKLLVDEPGLQAQLAAQLGPATAPDTEPARCARYLAQWAINVVSFRDRDSIMTRFRYDPDPLNPATGWRVPLDPNLPDPVPEPHTVWGCKRPELLISETLAFHDRRTQDLSTDTLGSNHTVADGDQNFDQRFQPEGSLFVELYNPWTTQEPSPLELCNAPNGGVDLTKPSGKDSSGKLRSPVWRLITVNGTADPDDPVNPATVDRVVYFVDPNATLPDGTTVTLPSGGNVQFHADGNFGPRVAPVLPGRYTLIGPGQPTDTNMSTTYLGFHSGENPGNVPMNPNELPRRIVLMPNSNPATSQVAIYNAGGTTPDGAALSIKPRAAVVINQPCRLNISEPDDGYASAGAYNPATGYPTPIDVPLDAGGNSPMQSAVFNNGRTDNVRMIHLQRLANPLLPYNTTVPVTDPLYNPYRTIDTMPLDLAAFNGIVADDVARQTSPAITSINANQFYSRQRGQNNGSATTNNLWRQEPLGSTPIRNNNPPPPNPNPLLTTTFVFQSWLNSTLGYLNDPFGVPSSTAGYVGDPQLPFPWLNWNNRPFTSPLELMLVPAVSSRDVLRMYDLASAANPYDPLASPPSFPHLANLFCSAAASAGQLQRVLEFVGVSSPFTCAQIAANPNSAQGNPGQHTFHPPFNSISTYREPGRINLNTIYTQQVFDGLMNGFPTMANNPTFWAQFVRSRRDYSGNILDMPDVNCPTEFAKPFRSAAGGQMVPSLTGNVLTPTREINATLLRAGAAADHPLFQYDSPAGQQVDNTNRNPFFRYQGLERLSNLVTTRSNVYAVWITVGYFEVSPAPAGYNPAVYPDGYQLGQELGTDTGEIDRHRAFYIIDRTIPVGFQRGQDLNAEKAILVNRFIE